MERVPVGQEKDSAVGEMKSDILKTAEEAQIEASVELLAAFRQMLNKPAFSDVVFVCNDGKRVQGSRIILAGRSDVLKSLVMNGMAESHLSEITLPLISSPVLLSVFEFLYTGTLSDHLPQSWRMACEVVSASRFFLLPKLEKITRKFMHALTVSVGKDLPKAASLLTEAVGFKTMCDETDVSMSDLVRILSSNWLEKSFVRYLSENAFHYLLANSKGEGDRKRSTDYLRFRQVIRWWVNQSDFDFITAEEIVSLIAPYKDSTLSMYEDPDYYNTYFGDSGCASHHPTLEWTDSWSLLQLNNESRESALTLLSNIHYHKIHPVLLTKVVEPLKFVSSADMLNAFRWHALQRHFVFKKYQCGWELGESHTTLEHGYVVKKTEPRIGLAVGISAIGLSFCLYQWSFIVEEISESFCELGFMYYAAGVEVVLDGEKLSDQHRARVLKIQGREVAVNWQGAGGGRVDWKTIQKAFSTGTRILFTFDPTDHTCSLNIGDKYCGVVWKNLPDKIYYPAVSLGSSAKGRVRIELGTGLTYCES